MPNTPPERRALANHSEEQKAGSAKRAPVLWAQASAFRWMMPRNIAMKFTKALGCSWPLWPAGHRHATQAPKQLEHSNGPSPPLLSPIYAFRIPWGAGTPSCMWSACCVMRDWGWVFRLYSGEHIAPAALGAARGGRVLLGGRGGSKGGGWVGLWGDPSPPPGDPELLEAPEAPKNFLA